MDFFEDLINLFLPSNCIYCGVAGSSICIDCSRKLNLKPRLVSRAGINGFASCEYEMKISKLVNAFKESGQTSLARVMSPPMTEALANFDLKDVALIPMPSKRESFSARGFEPATVLARSVARHLAKRQKVLLPVQNILSYSKRVADQASLSGHDRRTNLIGSMVASKKLRAGELATKAILIDDIVTTGSTFAEAKRCLTGIGVEVIGFVAFAETLPKNLQKRHEKVV